MSVDISGKVIVSFETEDEDEDEIEISAEEFEVEYLSSGERQLGPENCYQIYYESDSFSLRKEIYEYPACLLYTSPSPRDKRQSRMPSSA